MGSTVTCEKLATAFADDNGKIWYTLFESTYEKNCYPHIPRWSCIFFGGLGGAMKTVFNYASSAESGSLQGKSGCIKPESYIRGWLKELAEPVLHKPENIILKTGSGWRVPIPQEALEWVSNTLGLHGFPGMKSRFEAGESLELDLGAHADVVAAIFDRSHGISPWRVIERVPSTDGTRNTALGFSNKTQGVVEINFPKVLRLFESDEGLLQMKPDMSWEYGGWEYSVLGGLIQSLWEVALKNPKEAIKAITEARLHVKNAGIIPDGITAKVDARNVDSAYGAKCISRFQEKHQVIKSDHGFKIKFKKDDKEIIDDLSRLQSDCVTWLLPATTETQELVQAALDF